MTEKNQDKFEGKPSAEMLTRAPRFVVFGDKTSGSDEVAKDITEITQSNPSISVKIIRQTTAIEDGFYGRIGESKVSVDKGGIVTRMSRLVLGKRAPSPITRITPTVSDGPDMLPQGVVILPNMRQRNPSNGTGMSIPTPIDQIVALCEQHQVPFVHIEAHASAEQIEQEVQELVHQ